jgi:hypothetical protein
MKGRRARRCSRAHPAGIGVARADPPDAQGVEERIGEAVDAYLKEIVSSVVGTSS